MTQFHTLPDTLQGSNAYPAASHEEREQIWFIINRAYQNIYGMNMPSTPEYQKVIFEAAITLHKDARKTKLNDKLFMQACEDVIRICDEHHSKAEKHLARASNPLYLREMALDNALERQRYQQAIGELLPDSAVMAGCDEGQCTQLKGRVEVHSSSRPSSSEIMNLAYQQLALNSQKESD